MILDLNLSELPAFKDYEGFVPELLGIADNAEIKEITEVFKNFSKTSGSWIFADLAFFNLRDYLKRCRFGSCNFWKKDYPQNTTFQ
jgi:hypothetical protein